MTKETKQDVFDEMKWELIRNLANTIDQNGGLRPVEDATKVGENYAKRYAAATGGETEAQRTCPYCHKPHRVIPTDDEFGLGGEPENFLRIGMTGGDVWNGIPPKLTPGGAIHTVMPVGYDNAEVDETISINYCPMCGRNLDEAGK